MDSKTDPQERKDNGALAKKVLEVLRLIKSSPTGAYMSDLKKLLSISQGTMSAIATQLIRIEGVSAKRLQDSNGEPDFIFTYDSPDGSAKDADPADGAASPQYATFKESAIRILCESGEALHYNEITKRAIAKGMIKPSGRTPWASMSITIGGDIRKNGPRSVFVKVAPGTFVINSPCSHKYASSKPATFKESAIMVLCESGEALHYDEITKRAIARGLIESTAKEPATAMYSSIGGDIRKNGPRSAFTKVAPGTFAINSPCSRGTAFGKP